MLCGATLYGNYQLYMSLRRVSPTLRLVTQRQLKSILEWVAAEGRHLSDDAIDSMLLEIDNREDEESAKEFI
jgi:hypothetical protein